MHVVNNTHGANRGLRSLPEHRGERGCRLAPVLQGPLLPHGRGREAWEEHRLSSPHVPSGGPGCRDLQASITLPRRTPGASLESASSAESCDPEPAPVPSASDFSLPGHPECLPSASSLASRSRQKDLFQRNILGRLSPSE